MDNKELLEKYVEENHEKLSSFIRARISRDESEDILQTVYYRMLNNNSTIEDEKSREGYLKMAARRLSYNLFKKKSNCKPASSLVTDVQLIHCHRNKDTRDVAEMAKVALSCLDEPYLSVVKSFYLEGKTINEISACTNTPEGTIKRRLHVARNRMKEFMEASGYESSDVFV